MFELYPKTATRMTHRIYFYAFLLLIIEQIRILGQVAAAVG